MRSPSRGDCEPTDLEHHGHNHAGWKRSRCNAYVEWSFFWIGSSGFYRNLHIYWAGEWELHGNACQVRIYIQPHQPGRDDHRGQSDGAEFLGYGYPVDDHPA